MSHQTNAGNNYSIFWILKLDNALDVVSDMKPGDAVKAKSMSGRSKDYRRWGLWDQYAHRKRKRSTHHLYSGLMVLSLLLHFYLFNKILLYIKFYFCQLLSPSESTLQHSQNISDMEREGKIKHNRSKISSSHLNLITNAITKIQIQSSSISPFTT